MNCHMLGLKDAGKLLAETRKDEKEAASLLSKLASLLNFEAQEDPEA